MSLFLMLLLPVAVLLLPACCNMCQKADQSEKTSVQTEQPKSTNPATPAPEEKPVEEDNFADPV